MGTTPTLGSTSTFTGDVTYYEPAGGAGACGTPLQNSDMVAAVSTTLYDAYTQGGNPNNNQLCGQMIELTYNDGSTVTVPIKDRCEACAVSDVDLTPPAFTQLVGSTDVGRTQASWKFVS
ncbi:hypothetical protein VMCG_03998 [Cytospora schulzeri]|uniref:RlpA-like protein double-psi beta-barrel domain-containing protein n=1 Tax=Cytospora schulzeri TaxID=448051 RepID=A0A423WTF1_9PEZI|nr:hypothetical protein VMCG_03998 [Valsa malicola]